MFCEKTKKISVSPFVFVGLLPEERARIRFNSNKIETIISYFMDYYKLTLVEIFINQRGYNERIPVKYWIYFFCYKTKEYSYRELATAFGTYRHSSISKAVKVLENDLVINKVTQEIYQTHLDNLTKLFITFT